jgi:LysM repeat protein
MKTLTLLSLSFLAFSEPLLAASQEQRIGNLEQEVSSLRSKVASISERLATSGKPTQRSTSSSSESGYRIKKGDTLWGIAKSRGLSVSALQKANPGLNPSRLKIGKSLCLPRASKSTSVSTSSHSSPTSSYAIKSGDTLGEVANRHGTSLRKLMASNPGLNPRKLQIGREIKVPGNNRSIVATKPAPEPRQRVAEAPRATPPPRIAAAGHSSRPELVTVSQNRRLDDIARFYGTDVPTINSLNQVSLSPAQVIKMGSQIYVPQQ